MNKEKLKIIRKEFETNVRQGKFTNVSGGISMAKTWQAIEKILDNQAQDIIKALEEVKTFAGGIGSGDCILKSTVQEFADTIKDNPTEIIKWVENEIKEYQELIKILKKRIKK